MVYTGITLARMQEGEMRCDVNLSVRKKGDKTLGTRTEMKNINSFAFVGKAIEGEFKRQVDVLEAGGTIIQETRRFDDKTGQSTSMRTKEDADDYRYCLLYTSYGKLIAQLITCRIVFQLKQ